MARLQIKNQPDKQWQSSVSKLYQQARSFQEGRDLISTEDRARLALSALSLLWSGWSPEMIAASAMQSMLAGVPIVVGMPLALAILEADEQALRSAGDPLPEEPLPVPVMTRPASCARDSA